MRKVVLSIYLCVLVVLVCLNVYSFSVWMSKGHTALSSIAVFVAITAFAAALLYMLLKTELIMAIRSNIFFALILFAASFLLKAAFVVLVKTPQYSDFQLLYQVTVEIGENNSNYLAQRYFTIWAYQTGFPAAMSLFVRLFGRNVLALILVNCVFLSAGNVLVYLTARTFAGEKIARITAALYMFFPFVFGLSSVYTNQHLAVMLFYSGVYTYFSRRGSCVLWPLAAGLLLALGNAARPEGIIFVGAFAALLIYDFLNEFRLHIKEWMRFISDKLLPIASVIVSFFLCFTLVSKFFVVSGLNPEGLANNFPLYKFVVGLNHTTGGNYSNEDCKRLFTELADNPELRDKESIDLIRQRLSVSPRQLLALFGKKTKAMWTSARNLPAFGSFKAGDILRLGGIGIPIERIRTFFTFTDYLYFILIFVMCIFTAVNTYRNKKADPAVTFFALLFGLSVFVFLFIEVQARYSYFVMPAVFMLAAPGLSFIHDRFQGKGKEKSPAGIQKVSQIPRIGI